MRKIYILGMLFISQIVFSQVTISNGNHVVEISGLISSYYNYRPLKEGFENKKNNRFELRDAQLQIEGRIGKIWEYELKYDFADASYNGEDFDAENPGLMEASVTYNGLKFVDIQGGYGKLYYGRSSIVPFQYSPFWQRAIIAKGDLQSARDLGITLKKDFWNQKVNAYAGIYTGLGEMSVKNGDNDASGKFEYVGRVDVSYPSRVRYRDIDDDISPIPMFQLGLNARYADKALPSGKTFPPGAAGDYDWKMINGKRYGYGLDFFAMYKGVSAEFEIHKIKAEPQNASDPLYKGYTLEQTGGYVQAGGFLTQLNYNFKKINTIFSVRYEELDLNDLVPGKAKRFSGAVAYKINGYNAMIKAQYFNILQEESIDPLKWKEQFRIGFQLGFK
ncbi:porin [Epilithonimonas hominis]|uniref:porin n=1 Tax=Epilithonimonas hominis TaxID=420404 RepID=UPI00289D7533|nr:porin [Epilithonimonas hominis]